eukprot:1394486-Amorphochlora_amoeboformis.AAC.1
MSRAEAQTGVWSRWYSTFFCGLWFSWGILWVRCAGSYGAWSATSPSRFAWFGVKPGVWGGGDRTRVAVVHDVRSC